MDMNTLAFLALQLIAVGAMTTKQKPPPGVMDAIPPAMNANKTNKLRGSGSNASVPEVKVASPNGLSTSQPAVPAPVAVAKPSLHVDERGERGHFYYADACDDCYYKHIAGQCGCKPAVEYFACLTTHCHGGNSSRFNDKCMDLSGKCSSELTIECRGPDTFCEGKFSQLPSGGMGLTLDLEGMNDDAFCGPNGKCLGEIHMKVNVHAAQTVFQVSAPSAPAPATAAAPAAPLVPAAPPAPAAAPAGTWVECGLPNKADAKFENAADWITCRAAVVDGKAACDVPMFATLEASKDKASYCVLTEGTAGNPPKRLTAPAWYHIGNAHDKSVGEPTASVQPPPASSKRHAPATRPELAEETPSFPNPYTKDHEAERAKQEADKDAKQPAAPNQGNVHW